MIKISPNSWEDCKWWYEDEPEVYQYMQDHEFKIKQYAREHWMTVRDTIIYLYSHREEGLI